MLDLSQSPHPLLDDFSIVFKFSKESECQTDKLTECASAVGRVAHFFECDNQRAIILSLLLHKQFHNEEVSIIEVIEHLGLKASAAILIHHLLEKFVEQGWLKPEKNTKHSPFTGYKFNGQFLHTIVSGDWSYIKSKKISSSFDLLETFGKLLIERRNSEITFEKLKNLTRGIINSNSNITLCSFILDAQLEDTVATVFLAICYRYYCGTEKFELDTIISDIKLPREKQFYLRQEFKIKKGQLFELDLIDSTYSTSMFTTDEEYRLTENAVSKFVINKAKVEKKLTTNHLEKIDPDKIPQKKLFYDAAVETQLNRLDQLLEVNNFKAFSERMISKGMKPGLTMLYYGSSGTGKTETVYQMARKSGRSILMADASAIRSKWVGETEKNVKKLFREYKKSISELSLVPILLFNEADSVFGRRRDVVDRVEQMENTLQNILLQELEDFEGIFIATTNLEGNIDTAFDRRILYKVRFGPPSDTMRLSIWKDKLPDVPEELICNVNNRYKLTGGQIENIRKKIEVDSLLDIKSSVELEYLNGLAEEEVLLRSESVRRPVGFTRARENC